MIYIMIYLEPHWILIHETSLLPQSQFFAVQLSCFFWGGEDIPITQGIQGHQLS